MENFVAMRLNQSVTAKTLVGGLLSLAAQRAKRGELATSKIKSINTLVNIKTNTEYKT